MPSTLPEGDPAPVRRTSASGGARRARAAGRSASTCTCRSARSAAATATSTPTRRSSSAAARARRAYAEHRAAARSTWPSPVLAVGGALPGVDTVFFGGGTPTLLPVGRPGGACSTRCARRFGLAAGAEVTTEANPDSVTPESLQQLRRWRLHPGVLRHAVGRAARARDPGPHPRPGAGPAGRGLGASGRAGREPRPDLRHAGGVAGRLGRRASPPRSPARPTTSRRTRWSSRAGTKLAGRVARGEVPAPEDDDEADKYELADAHADAPPASAGTRSATGRARRRTPRGTTSATGPAATGGASDPAPTATSAACAGGTSSTPRRTPRGWPPGTSPAQAREVLTVEQRQAERVLLGVRLARGPAGRRRSPDRDPGRAAHRRRAGRWDGGDPRPGPADPARSPAGRHGRFGAPALTGRARTGLARSDRDVADNGFRPRRCFALGCPNEIGDPWRAPERARAHPEPIMSTIARSQETPAPQEETAARARTRRPHLIPELLLVVALYELYSIGRYLAAPAGAYAHAGVPVAVRAVGPPAQRGLGPAARAALAAAGRPGQPALPGRLRHLAGRFAGLDLLAAPALLHLVPAVPHAGDRARPARPDLLPDGAAAAAARRRRRGHRGRSTGTRSSARSAPAWPTSSPRCPRCTSAGRSPSPSGAIVILRSPWRWLFLLHPLLTLAVVVVTGNHYWTDGIVASVIVLVALLDLPPVAPAGASRLSRRRLGTRGIRVPATCRDRARRAA